jgi:glutamyl-Q tRNA(Asp) synthetase
LYVGRFAPSPTGPLHLGSLVTAVASYADARAAKGRWLLRIEDIDRPRCTARAEAEIRRQLAAYGFEQDGEVIRQSERGDVYEATLQQLAAAGHLFACSCTRRELASVPRNHEGEIIYPGTCRARPAPANTAHALRIRVPDDAAALISFDDVVCGTVAQNLATDLGDFVLRRADGLYAYQLAVVVDDAMQGITHVVRGADLVLNTPRQIFLQRLLGLTTPSYLHVPLVRNALGEKLSKQTRATAISVDEVLPTLAQAWAFLRQEPIGNVRSPGDFWRHAAELWTPSRVQCPQRA